MTDLCQRFLIDHSTLRGQIVTLDHSLTNIFAKHDYPLEIQGLLGELLAAAVMLVSIVKIRGSLIIQAQGGHPVNLLMVECDNDHRVRALARWDGDVTGKGFKELLAGASLALTLDPVDGERYQGIVGLEGERLSDALEHYFQQSEQLRTRLWLSQGNGRAAGLLLQQLPFHSGIEISEEQNEEDWARLTCLANTLTAEEQLTLSAETVLERLFHEEQVRLFAPEPIEFRCTCSRERFADALAGLGADELNSIVAEQGQISATCQFCNEIYVFDAVDVGVLLNPQATQAPDRPQ